MMTRRQLLRAALITGAAIAMPMPAFALDSSTVTLVKQLDGSWGLKPEDAARVGAKRAALMNQTANRTWNIGTYQGLTPSKRNGLLTKGLRQLSKARGAGGLIRALATTALIAGLQWALADGSLITDAGENNAERTQRECKLPGMYPTIVSPITMNGTGMYRTSNGANIIAISKQTRVGWSGGTVPAPSGWSWSYQTTALGTTEVWFTRNVTTDNCKDFKWPKVPMPELPDLTGPEVPLPDDVKKRLPDVIIEVAPPITAPKPDNQEEPDNKGLEKGPGVVPLPDTVTPGDLSNPWEEVFGPDPWFEFDPAENTGTQPGTNPTPTPTPTPSPSPTTGTGQPYPSGDPVEPGEVEELPTFDKFTAPFAKLFDPFGAAFGGSGTCTAFPIPGKYGSIDLTAIVNPCPVLEPIAGRIAFGSAAIGAFQCVDNILEA